MNTLQSSPSPLEHRQSKIGVVSLVSSILSTLLVLGVFPLMSYLDKNKIDVPEPWKSIGALYMPLVALLSLLGIGTGIAGLFVKSRRKGFALLGLIIGCCSILLFVGIVAMVFAFKARNAQ